MADFSSFLSHLTDAVSAAWPDRFSTRYRKVKVLLMTWDKDDLGVETEVRNLESVFRGLYHYDTEYWKIPSRRSAVEVSRKVADLVDAHGQEGNLLILYYGGHARASEQPGGSPVWAANRSRDSPTVQSSILHSFLGEIDCDVLLLHDCLHAYEARDTFIGSGVVETLAAGGVDVSQSEGDNDSFTASLVQELAHAAHTTDWLSMVELHRRLINRLQVWTPNISFTDDSYSIVQVDRRTGQPMFERPRRRTPVHSFLSRKPKTIVLTPLPPRSQSQSEESLIQLNPPTGNTDIITEGPGILLTCRLRDQHIDAEKWRQWLLDVPEGAKNIQISAVFPSFGTVLLLELPLAVWDLLPSSPAISFIAYTTGGNHISEFRRALLGSDVDELENTFVEQSADEDDSDTGRSEGRSSHRGRRSGKEARETYVAPSLWPKAFEHNHGAIDAANNMPYCLTLAEMQGDDKTSKAERIIRAFVQDADSPPIRYIYDEIRDFCAPANFEALSTGQDVGSEAVAIFDEPSPTSPHSSMNGMRFLDQGQLYEALAARPVPQLIDTEAKDDDLPHKKRSVHVGFQSGMDVKLQPGNQGFQLSFHLPFFAWRQGSSPSLDTRYGSNGPLRGSKEVGFLNQSRGTQTYLHEAQISCMIVGVDNRHWTAYGFFDTYHDGGESRHDVRYYQSTQGGAVMDPLTCGRHMADSTVPDAREYFLTVMESCVLEVKGEWENAGRQVLKDVKAHATKGNNRRAQRASDEAMGILEQLTQGLAGTISAWDRFRETDLAYFDLDNAPAEAPSPIRNIESAIHDLRALQSSLIQKTSALQSLTSRRLSAPSPPPAEPSSPATTTFHPPI
ncbi:hypothetical protein CHGG_05417 [Chaetomium globosum CBS 148.51]|uniref:Uncharacterized protein n=1 Tax=Chaetomium globosum (strain ATCC 6205 / CBS 148.51 / DSM 1962 / NBRC 6347 / NRRL 1970) TaxID=306901 RepID=Q2H7E8_CHAGB|nr:uncharacterized protein CHGG_05417 [Chaetomium globosum CBS 148.51]EAQ88798.1 hypothetical protein CHGG_05417 [Chaetomium globosum CBS 148.51]